LFLLRPWSAGTRLWKQGEPSGGKAHAIAKNGVPAPTMANAKGPISRRKEESLPKRQCGTPNAPAIPKTLAPQSEAEPRRGRVPSSRRRSTARAVGSLRDPRGRRARLPGRAGAGAPALRKGRPHRRWPDVRVCRELARACWDARRPPPEEGLTPPKNDSIGKRRGDMAAGKSKGLFRVRAGAEATCGNGHPLPHGAFDFGGGWLFAGESRIDQKSGILYIEKRQY
jgi:hypothetical protein